MSTDHPGRPFRYGIRFKIAVSIGVIMIALMAVDILWNLSLQNAQAENEARVKPRCSPPKCARRGTSSI